MTCPSCARENRAGARFCGGCGASLAPRCSGCGAIADPDQRFCDACGASLGAAPVEKAIARKVVTVVFADLIGSMALHERRDAESARRVTDRYHRAMRAAVEVHGGRVVQLLGDGVLAAFGVPRVAEDDAIRAVRAAVGMQRAFRELVREQGAAMDGIGLRVAVNTGEVVVSDDETAVIGDASNVAARLQHEARDGEVIVGEATQRLVGERVTLAPLGSFALRGREQSVAAYRVVSLERPASAQALAFVGRDDELRRLLAVYDDACAGPGARLAVLLGSPGLGKSRLLAELSAQVGGTASVLAARCDEARGATFAPLAQALRTFLRVDDAAERDGLSAAIGALVPGSDADRTRIAAGIAALLAGAPSPPEETFFVVRRLLAALAAVRPVVLVIDDLHWAESLLLDLVEHLVQWSPGVPLFVVAAARPELREARSALASRGPLVSEVVTLGGLDAGSATRLAANVIGGADLPAALAGRVLAASEGNPLFVAELVRMLVHDGSLRREGERWVPAVELADLEMPTTIQVLLAARLERLRPEERVVLERAAVIGRHFSRAAVAHLLGREAATLDAQLEALRRSELVEPDTGWFLGEPGLRFHHVLIRDAAYRRVLRETRAELHERFADWVAARAGESIEHDETLGWHLEQAHQNRRELGPLDAHGRELGARAAQHLGSAGRRALARDDVPVAAGLLGRAFACLEHDDPARAELALDWCEALLATGDVAPAQHAIAELARFAPGSERVRAWHTCFRGQLAVLTDPEKLHATVGEVAAAAQALGALQDSAGEAKARFVHAMALARLGEVGACEAALDAALAAARRVRDRRRANAVLAGVPLAALWGPSPVTRASGRCLDVVRVLRITQDAPAVEAVALRCQALLEALRGRSDAAQRMLAASRRLVEELGVAQQLLESDVFAGHIALLEGDAATAERLLRSAYDGFRERGLRIDAARAAALLGHALLALDRAEEAEALSVESEALAGEDLKAAMGWRAVRAAALARRGDPARALDLARAAVEIAARTDALLDHADARIALAQALRAAGHPAEADTEERRARELWERKGATLLLDRVGRAERAKTESPTAETARAPRRRARANRATAHAGQLDAAVAARDAARLRELFAADVEVVHHPTGAVYGAEGAGSRFVPLTQGADAPSVRHEPLATLGDALGLFRARTSAEALADTDLPIGAMEIERLVLIEAREDARASRVEVFDEDRAGDAISRLYERYADTLRAAAEHPRAEATARSVRAVLGLDGRLDGSGFREALSPALRFVDHQPLGAGRARGPERIRRGNLLLHDQIADMASRVNEILVLEPSLLVALRTMSGRQREGGGSVEYERIELWGFGRDGLLTHLEHFERADAAAACARADQLLAGPLAVMHRRVRANAATANAARLDAVVAECDEGALPDVFADPCEIVDHQSGTTWDRAGSLRSWRASLRAQEFSLRQEPLATLGDALLLLRQSQSGIVGGRLDAGAFEGEQLVLLEVDREGRRCAAELFAPAHLGRAIARLYERHGGGSPLASALEGQDVRDVLGLSPDALLVQVGERELLLCALAPDGRMTRTERFDAERVGAALARYDALAGEERALTPFPNAATRSMGALQRAWHARDWQAVAGVYAPNFRMSDRRALARVELDRAQFFDTTLRLFRADEPRLGVDERQAGGVLATRGDRLVLAHTGFVLRDRDAGPSVTSQLTVIEVDESGLRTALLGFDPDALDDAYAELDARFAAGEAAGFAELLGALERERAAWGARRFAHLRLSERAFLSALEDGPTLVGAHDGRSLTSLEEFDASQPESALARFAELSRATPVAENLATRSSDQFHAAWRARDWDALVALFADDYHESDRRPSALVELDREQYLAGLRPHFGWEVSNHTSELVATRGSRLALFRTRFRGSDGDIGPTEGMGWLGLVEVDASGKRTSGVMFGLDDLPAALAELDARHARAHALLRIPPNAATRAHERFEALARAKDRAGLEALVRPDAVWDERRRGTLFSGGRDMMIESALFAVPGGRNSSTLLATAGDRLALQHHRWTAAPGGPPFESEMLSVFEVDAEGRIAASVFFDVSDRRAASRELAVRSGLSDARVAICERDLARLRVLLPPGFVCDDHRRLGVGRIEDLDGYIAWLAALFEESSDALIEPLYYLAIEPHGSLAVGHTFGTSRSSGAFESFFVQVENPGGVELFDLEDLDRARARFEALRPEPQRVPPNEAVRTFLRVGACVAHADWDGLRALAAPDFVFEDRRKIALLSGDLELYVRNLQVVREWPSRRARTETVATHGERLALSRVSFSGDSDAGGFAGDFLHVVEVDARGRLRAVIHFDPDDEGAAHARLVDPLRIPPNAATRASERRRAAFEVRDWQAFRALCAPELVYDDRRRLVRTTGNLDMYVASLRQLGDAGTRLERTVLATAGDRLALEQSGFVAGRAGSELEGETLRVTEIDAAGRLTAIVIFDPADRRAASREMLERWFRGEAALYFPPSVGDCALGIIDHDLARCRAGLADDFVMHDRRRSGLGRMEGADEYLSSLPALWEQSSDVFTDTLYHLAVAPHGSLSMGRMVGTLDGGGPFESLFLRLNVYAGGRCARTELFELDDLEHARARFEELRPRSG